MSRYTDFIAARITQDTDIPAPVAVALRSLAAMHAGPDECTGCGHTTHGGTTPAEACEQAHEIAAIWADHPDYPGEPAHRALLVQAEADGRLHVASYAPMAAADLVRQTTQGVYLTPHGRSLLPEGHPARKQVSPLVWDWGRDPYPHDEPEELLTKGDIRQYPAYYILGPGRERAEATRCPHDYCLTDSCPGCDADDE
ncbi:hypothetical protein [Nocardiopsis alba]|uniref:hypothetical protein n=1 Tax=Nocardiopsis alba TaxID=53437 RepID=UPI003D7248A3